MTQETYTAISDMMGDAYAEFIAMSLKNSYKNLLEELVDQTQPPRIFSYDPIEEADYILQRLKALELTYDWYATDNIKD